MRARAGAGFWLMRLLGIVDIVAPIRPAGTHAFDRGNVAGNQGRRL
jgi:hypothetical protein